LQGSVSANRNRCLPLIERVCAGQEVMFSSRNIENDKARAGERSAEEIRRVAATLN
jgi:hypothetical protein